MKYVANPITIILSELSVLRGGTRPLPLRDLSRERVTEAYVCNTSTSEEYRKSFSTELGWAENSVKIDEESGTEFLPVFHMYVKSNISIKHGRYERIIKKKFSIRRNQKSANDVNGPFRGVLSSDLICCKNGQNRSKNTVVMMIFLLPWPTANENFKHSYLPCFPDDFTGSFIVARRLSGSII